MPPRQARNDLESRSDSQTSVFREAVEDGSQRAKPLKDDGGFRIRAKKLFNTKAVPHEPALRLNGDWKSEVAPHICDGWVESQKKYDKHAISLIDLSRMKALDYERKHRDEIPEDQRLLPGNPTRQDYYEAQADAFLNAIGINGEAQNALLESFKLTGTGGLHRQHVSTATAINNLVIGTSQLLSSQHPAAATALYGVRLLLQGLTTERILDAGWRRLRNAGTEDVLPHGRADAAPGTKNAPTMFEAAHAVIWKLRGVDKNLRKTEAAMKALETASAAFEKSGANADRDKVELARQELEIAFARICHQMEVKASYKASSESAKVEFRGNQRYLGTSYAGTTLTLGAGLFSILTPVLGAAAAPVTGGVSLAVAVIVASLYVGYQLSTGPSKDGQAKAKRAIVALSKSADVLSSDKAPGRKGRATALKMYDREIRKARFKFGKAGAEARRAAKANLLAQLEEISQQEKIESHMDPRRNWETYCAHLTEVSKIEKTAAQEEWPQSRIDDRITRLNEQFQATHEADFCTKAMAEAWKNPMRIRMDNAIRLLKGKVAHSHNHLINLAQHPGLKARFSRARNERAIDAAKAELRKNLLDMFNLGLALHEMKPLADGHAAAPSASRAATAIGAIEDEDVRSIFCGDGTAQVEAANKAKKLTAGEAERYVYTNAGASSIGIGLNVAVGAVDFGLGVAKTTNAVHVGLRTENPEGKPTIPEYNDYKFAAISQAGAPLMAHMNAGNRAAFQKTQMPNALKITTRQKEGRIELLVSFNRDIVPLEESTDAVKEKLDALVEQLANADSVPDKIILSMPRQVADVSEPDVAASRKIAFNLQPTSGYHRAQYRNASRKEKWKVMRATARMIGRHAFMSVAGLPAQGIAQLNLKRTRNALERAAELEQEVRDKLSAVTKTGIVPQSSKA